MAEHTSNGGIGSWWEFRANGTFTMRIGAMVTAQLKRSGETLTMPPATVNGPPVLIQFRVQDDILHLAGDTGKELTYTRLGAAPAPADPLLGRWRPTPLKTPSADPNLAALEKANANAVYLFSADGTETLRIPFTAREGTWDATASTFRFTNEQVDYRFSRSGDRLVLGQPPDGKKTDTYLRDPVFPE